MNYVNKYLELMKIKDKILVNTLTYSYLIVKILKDYLDTESFSSEIKQYLNFEQTILRDLIEKIPLLKSIHV